MKKTGALFLALALCIPLAMAACGGGGGGGGNSTNSEYISEDTPVTIPDAFDLITPGEVISQIDVSGIADTIFSVTVDVYILHTWDDDLIIDLLSPDGTTVNLAYWAGSDGDNFNNTRFDDSAMTSIGAGSAPFSGSYRPMDSLSLLNGEDPNGTWSLIVTDDFPDDEGSLRGWGLNIN